MRCCLLISSRSGESRSKEESGGGRCWGGKPCINVCCTYPQSQNYLFITLLSSQGDFCQDSTYTLNLASKRTDRWGRFIRCLNSQSYFFSVLLSYRGTGGHSKRLQQRLIVYFIELHSEPHLWNTTKTIISQCLVYGTKALFNFNETLSLIEVKLTY